MGSARIAPVPHVKKRFPLPKDVEFALQSVVSKQFLVSDGGFNDLKLQAKGQVSPFQGLHRDHQQIVATPVKCPIPYVMTRWPILHLVWPCSACGSLPHPMCGVRQWTD